MHLNTKQHIKKTLMTGLLWLTASFIHGQSIDLATTLKNNDMPHLKDLWQKAFTDYAQDMFTNLGQNKINQLFKLDGMDDIIDADQFIGLLNNNTAFRENALKFIKVE